jgi:hypothetical protein
MKVIAAKKDGMVRIKMGGSFIYVTGAYPVEVRMEDPEVQSQVMSMMKLGWLTEVKDVEVKNAEASSDQSSEVQENQRFGKRSQQRSKVDIVENEG